MEEAAPEEFFSNPKNERLKSFLSKGAVKNECQQMKLC